MTEDKYYVTMNNHTVAENMDLETALILTKAIFSEYYQETDMVVAISKMEVNNG